MFQSVNINTTVSLRNYAVMFFNKDMGELAANKDLVNIAKLILEMSFGKDRENEEVYLENALKMVSYDVKALQMLDNKEREEKHELTRCTVTTPENGGWIKAFYNFNKQYPDNKEDVLFIYEFKRGTTKILAKKEDIVGWANKWHQFVPNSDKTNSNKLKLLMGDDNWHGRRISNEGYTTHPVRFKLFGKRCANKGKDVDGCYGKVFMDEKIFTRTKNDSGLCKHCEYLDRKLSSRSSPRLRLKSCDKKKETEESSVDLRCQVHRDEDSLHDIAERTALFVLND